MNLFVHDLKTLCDAQAPLIPARMPPKHEPWRIESELDTQIPGVDELGSVDYKQLLAELQTVSPLQVTTFGSAAHLESTIPWSQVQLTRRKGIADARDVEMAFRFDQWGGVYAVSLDHSTPLGLYVYDPQGRILATIRPARSDQAPSFCAKIPTEPRRRRYSSHRTSRDPDSCLPRIGYGPRTHANSRVARVLEKYTRLNQEALPPNTPTSCMPISPREVARMLEDLIQRELPVDLVCGAAAFWQFSHTRLTALEEAPHTLTLHGPLCTLGLRLDRIQSTWLARSHHEGQFVYSLLFYDTHGHLDLAILLPKTPIAASVEPWRKLLRKVSRAYVSLQEHAQA